MNGGFGALTDALSTIVTTIDSGYAEVASKTDAVLGALFVIDVVLWGCWTVLGAESVSSFARKFVSIQIWLLIIRGFHGIAKWLMHTLVDAASAAGGVGTGGIKALLDPSAIAGMGLDATLPLADKMDKISKWDVGTRVLIGLVFLVLMLAFIVMAVNIAIAVIEYYMYLTLGSLLIPFALLAQTRFLADKGINAVLAATLKLTAYAFVLAIIEPILGNVEFSKSLAQGDGLNWNDIFSMLLVVAFCAGMVLKAPQIAAGLIHGSPSISGSGLVMSAAGAAIYGAGLLGSAAIGGVGRAFGWAGDQFDRGGHGGSGSGVASGSDSSMAAASRAGAMPAPAPIFVVGYAAGADRFGAPAPPALSADVIDVASTNSPRRLGGASGEDA
jgi:type IV secretion system protein TrbL